MVTKFEKRAVAWLLTAMMCLSVIFSGSTVAYAEDNGPVETAKGEAVKKSTDAEGGETQTGTEDETKISDAETPEVTEGSQEKKEDDEEKTETEKDAKAVEQAEGTFGDYEYQVLDGGTVEITKYSGAGGQVEIPDTIDGKSISSIGQSAFGSNQDVTQVELPATVTELQYMSFYKCNNLEKVIIPADSQLKKIGGSAFFGCALTEIDCSSVQEIGNSAFRGCDELTSVTLGDKLTSLEGWAFERTGLLTIQIPQSLSVIESGVFRNCGNLKEVILPDSTVSIGDYAFEYCRSLKGITLPSSLVSIGEGAFYFSGLEKIEIPESVTSIGDYGFWGCQNLSSVTVGNKLAYISDFAFGYCNLTAVTFGDNIKKIGESAYALNVNLSEIDIPKNITEMEYGAFRNCTALSKVNIPDTLDKIGGFALYETAWYNSQADGIVYAGNVLYDYKGDMLSDTVIEAKNGTLGIAGYAFYGDKNLKEIKIPETVTNIGDFAFHDCVSMTSIVIPDSVTEIGEKALGYKTKEAAQAVRNARVAGDSSEKMSDFTIYGASGSAAQTYARENSFSFVAQETDNPAPEGLRIVPEVTDNTYIIGSGDGVTITCTGDLKDFVNVMMDGQVVDKSNYTLREGSTILTFTTKYLDTLSVGKHRVTLNYTYASVDTELTVLAKGSNTGTNGTAGSNTTGKGTANGTANGTNGSKALVSPKTGDQASIILWVLAAMFAAGIGVTVILRKRSAQ